MGNKPSMIVKVLACSISAGDTMILSGNIIFLKPTLPYVPGMDVCGRVEEVSEGLSEFKEGDIIVASNGMTPVGGMAEYMLVDPSLAALKPLSVDITQAASCITSAATAFNAVKYIKENDRVLILGGSGGVGSSAITLAKLSGASYVVAVSTQQIMCLKLGADEVINYTQRNWWEVEEYQSNKFDVIIDTVGGGNFYDKGTNVLKTGKDGGYFIAVTGDDP